MRTQTNMSRTIARALRIHRYDIAMEILRRGDSTAAQSESLAVLAVVVGHLPTLQLLLRRGCPATEAAARTAISVNRIDMFAALLRHGCPATEPLADRAAEQWPFAIFEYLVNRWRLPVSDEIPFVAIRKRDPSLMAFAIQRGVAVGMRAVVEAAKTSPRLLREVLRSGSVPSPLGPDAVCAAIIADDVESVDMILEYGSELDESVTILAAFQGHEDIVRAVLAAGSPSTREAVQIARDRGHESIAVSLERNLCL